MLVFYFNSGQGGWHVGPLIALVPIILNFAPFLLELIPSVDATLWRRPASMVEAILTMAMNLAIPAIGVWGFVRFVRWVRQNGGWAFLLRLLFQGHQGGAAFTAGGGVRGPGGQGGHASRTQARRVTVEEVAEALSKLPTETYMTPEELAALPVHELKALLHGRGLEPVKCLEKGDLVRQLLQHGGSSADSCSICCEDYAPQCAAAAAAAAVAGAAAAAAAVGASQGESGGEARAGAGGDAGTTPDGVATAAAAAGTEGAAAAESEPVVLRVLRCGHRFHVECVDKWFLSATDYTREPACPLCNAPLLPGRRTEQQQQGQGEGQPQRR